MNDTVTASPSAEPGSSAFPNPNIQGNQYIYLAVYSSVPVYEMMIRGIGVMRRRSDSYLNATQILKVAGVDKGKRTKILEKDITQGVHEKVQGGYGRYQGTWIPFERAVELANSFNVSQLLAPLFDYTAPPAPTSLVSANLPGATTVSAPRHAAGLEPQSAATILSRAREQGLLPEASESRKRARESNGFEDPKKAKLEGSFSLNGGSNSNGLDGPWKLRRSTRASISQSIGDDPLRADRHKTILKSVFSLEPDAAGNFPDLSNAFPADIDIDTPIDDNEHTALHWAAALARIPIVEALVKFGADTIRGNNVGETPLIRAVLVTNNSDQDSFRTLLDILGSSLRTVDESGRTVLHHAALVVGVKGRSSSARYYMESVLEYIARNEKGQFREFVDAQDSHGDTALNIAARVGNRALVRILIEVGADKMRPNKLGLRAGDFGVEGTELAITPAEEIVASIRAPPPPAAPLHQSNEVLTSLTEMIGGLSEEFTVEMDQKNEVLEKARVQLRAATRDLAEQRRLIATWRDKVVGLDQKHQQIKNLERALTEEDAFDWTGRTEIDGSPSVGGGPGFLYRGPASTLSNLPAGIQIEFDADPPTPTNDSDPNALAHLFRLKSWYERVVSLLRQRVDKLQGGNAEQEVVLQRIVAGCCGVDPSKVEGMLDSLLAALESDGTSLDMTRVAGFLQRVKERH